MAAAVAAMVWVQKTTSSPAADSGRAQSQDQSVGGVADAHRVAYAGELRQVIFKQAQILLENERAPAAGVAKDFDKFLLFGQRSRAGNRRREWSGFAWHVHGVGRLLTCGRLSIGLRCF